MPRARAGDVLVHDAKAEEVAILMGDDLAPLQPDEQVTVSRKWLDTLIEAHRVQGIVAEERLTTYREAQAAMTQLEQLRKENAEYRGLFALQERRMRKAIKRWREGHPERELMQPDLGRLLKWLMKRRRDE